MNRIKTCLLAAVCVMAIGVAASAAEEGFVPIFDGKTFAGWEGNLKVFRVDDKSNLLLVNGAVPGPNGGLLIIRETNKVG